jgi:hypothetical protein
MTLPDTLPATDPDEVAMSADSAFDDETSIESASMFGDHSAAFPAEIRERAPMPNRPTLPIRVPVRAHFGALVLHAEVIGSTSNVVLLQGADSAATTLPLGAVVRLRTEWDRQSLNGRLAAHGVGGRFLVSIGERAIRRSRRFPMDAPGLARSSQLSSPVRVRITDLSSGGARVEGIELPVGSELELRFLPPGRPNPITVLGFVVRVVEDAGARSIGLAFRLVQPSMDVLRSTDPSAH